MATRDELFDIAVRYQLYLERYKAGLVELYDERLVELERELRRLVNQVGSGKLNSLSRAQFEALLAAVGQAVGRYTGAQREQWLTSLQALARYAAEFETQTLTRLVRPGVAIAEVEVALALAWQQVQGTPIQATGQLLDDFMDTWQNGVRRAVVGSLRRSHAQGLTVGQAVQALRGTRARRNADGVLTGPVRRAGHAVARTAAQHASEGGRTAARMANPRIVKEERWVSVLDGRTTTQCRSLDGRRFPVGEGPQPPIHYWCRSLRIAVLSQAVLAEEAARRGRQLQPVTTYYDWLRQQPAAFQDDVLGPVRGRLFRNGGLTSDEFARLNLDRNFQPLTLEEMRKLAPKAFDAAGI